MSDLVVKLGGVTYHVVACSKKLKNRGDIDSPLSKGKRRLRYRRTMPDQEVLEVLIHEALHALDWSKAEEWVHEAAVDLSTLLWEFGWRLHE